MPRPKPIRPTILILSVLFVAVFAAIALRPGVDLYGGVIRDVIRDQEYRDFILDKYDDPVNVTFYSSNSDDWDDDVSYYLFRQDDFIYVGKVWKQVGTFEMNETISVKPGLYRVVHPDDMGGLSQWSPGVFTNLGAGDKIFITEREQRIDLGVVRNG